MTQTITLRYLFDPLCGWCYGASRSVTQLAKHPAIDLRPMPTGLFAGSEARPMAGFAAQAWANDQRIAKLSGRVFSEEYHRNVLGDTDASLDSTVATRAVISTAEIAPSRVIEVLATIQSARYVDGKDVTSAAVVSDLLTKMDLEDAGARVIAADDDLLHAVDVRTDAARQLMSRFGQQGVPALIATINGTQSVLDSGVLYAGIDRVLTTLNLT
ncbi:DsbA family protein [Amylibacter ulvae]|uniref:DsbA family protein n=1 Tax=Paramylibacter ulvae TaxID=1651968 RepID=A0ABQ3CUT1_9RHOB|nr:DsbA family protein [Amylibacter ulvae]GHA43801.1 DsbA family protein [Amylibacter ulvae]